ncbi:helix-turn-helix transcriptional regulator [Streptomyces mirabilis]
MVNEQTGRWSFLTGYARVLIVVARDPAIRLRDIAAACHITERTAQYIVTDLEQAGYLRQERAGRRTRYILCLDGTLRHPTEAHLPVRALLELFTRHDSKRCSSDPAPGVEECFASCRIVEPAVCVQDAPGGEFEVTEP